MVTFETAGEINLEEVLKIAAENAEEITKRPLPIKVYKSSQLNYPEKSPTVGII